MSTDRPWYEDDPNVYVSKPLIKIFFNNGFGLYILTSHKFFIIPKFYGMLHKTFWEFGFKWLNWTFEVMWNKFFKI
jgi:hypothetical protein